MLGGLRLISRISGVSASTRRYVSSSVSTFVTPMRFNFPVGATPSTYIHRQQPSTIPSISELITGMGEIAKIDPLGSTTETLQMDSVKRKRKKMMKKHKLRKRRKAQRAMKIRLKK